ncbi:gluconate 2-dehydrogenase subunit 3 family protein [Roseitranquillus sediminis]|uniref:gluconate 2-dehydrogenase subunit 3 family protein n=1 Tax=Roseitranquillus sediminis TaxID=2809051 RepID=UPI001D0C2747|nr:gluconate 2-dehydrogenase subunit 3 family protein [Roseitranquillus sediminis]MBM9594943.1 gluconate 2-dehydrogenase subunit 3 family protein [Roseitranquillus sediminis]
MPERRFYNPDACETLVSLCDTILPKPNRAALIPMAPLIGAAMAAKRTDGTRRATLPTMREAWRRGLAAIDAEAQRERLLQAIDDEDVRAPEWRDLPPRRLFRHVLANEIVRIYYAHPDAWSEIGFGGPASPRGYVRLSPNRGDAWEADLERPKRCSKRRKCPQTSLTPVPPTAARPMCTRTTDGSPCAATRRPTRWGRKLTVHVNDAVLGDDGGRNPLVQDSPPDGRD